MRHPLIDRAIRFAQRATLCALVAFSAVPATQALELSAQQQADYAAMPEDVRAKLLMTMASDGNHDTAEWLLKAYPLTGKFATNRTAYIKGLILKARGDLTGAVKVYRDALADDPSLTLVRAELAKTLVALDEDDSALHHLKLLQAEAPDENEARGIKSFMDMISSRRPYTINGFVALAPSSNLNGGSRHNKPVFIYDPWSQTIKDFNYAQPKSGIGIAAGANAGYSKRLGNDYSAVLAAGVDATIYKDQDYNSYGLSQSAEIRRTIEGGYVGFGGVMSQSFAGGDFDLTSYSFGPRVSYTKQVTQHDSVNASMLYEWRKQRTRDNEDSTTLSINTSVTHVFDSTFSTSIFTGSDIVRNESNIMSYDSAKIGFSVYKELPFGLTTNLTGQASRTKFREVMGMIGEKRNDTRISGLINLTKRDFNIFGFAPSAEYSYSQNFSNSEAHDQINHSVDLRLTKDF